MTQFLRFACILLIFGLSTTSWSKTIAPLKPKFTPKRSNTMTKRFQKAIATGIQTSGYQALSKLLQNQVKICGAKLCAQKSFNRLKSRAKDLHATLATSISVTGKNYRLKLLLVNGTHLLSQIEGRCDICTFMEALSKTSSLTKELIEKSARKNNSLNVPAATAAQTNKEKNEKLLKNKIATSTDTTETDLDKKRWPLWPSLVAAGVGITSFTIGITLLSKHNDPTDCHPPALPDNAHCKSLYSTSGVGWTATTIGLAGMASSAFLFYLYYTDSKKESTTHRTMKTLSITPTSGGLLLGAEGQF